MGLNAKQQEAVDHRGHLLVLAPPGSGKTGTLIAKTGTILRADPNARIVIVSFTDAGANEAQHRLQKKLPPATTRRAIASTFHKHCLSQLRAAHAFERLITPIQGRELLQRAMEISDIQADESDVSSLLQQAQSRMDYAPDSEPVFAAYEEAKRRHKSIDLQDVIRLTAKGMRDGTVKPIVCTHLMCDEFQDVDDAQLAWLLEYAKLGVEITVVGDDDQSIYGWRSSLGYEAMQRFTDALHPHVVTLETNYRSHSEILEIAERTIQNNVHRHPKIVRSQRGPGGTVALLQHASLQKEASHIITAIRADAIALGCGVDQLPSGRWGILSRTNANLWLLACALRAAEIPFFRQAKRDDAPHFVSRFCGMLESLQSGDAYGIEQMLHALGLKGVEVKQFASACPNGLASLLEDPPPPLGSLPAEFRPVFKDVRDILPNWRNLTLAGEYARVLGGASGWWRESVIKKDEQAEFDSFIQLLTRPAPNLGGDFVSKLNRLFMPNRNDAVGGVALYTMHGAKGLEFDRVVVIQCNLGCIPTKMRETPTLTPPAQDGKGLLADQGSDAAAANFDRHTSEERRLFFVALTRARFDLTVSTTSDKAPSAFLDELNLPYQVV